MTQVCIGLESNFVTSNISAHFHKLQFGNILNPDWVQVIFLINFAKLAVGIFVRQMISIRPVRTSRGSIGRETSYSGHTSINIPIRILHLINQSTITIIWLTILSKYAFEKNLSKYEVLSPEFMEKMSTQTNTCKDRKITPAEHHLFFLQRAAIRAQHH